MLLFSITWGSVSGWWTPVCLLLGLLYAWLMYRQPVGLDKKYRYGLAAGRTVAVFLIALLLVSPLVRSVSYKQQKPLVLVAQDNSASVNTFKPGGFNVGQMVDDLGELKKALGDDYEVHEFNFDREVHDGLSKTFNGKQTNVAAALRKLNDSYVNQNIGAVVLATDGLYNQGADPQYEAQKLKTTFYTIALGDTIARRDLLISNVAYNKTAFLGNDFEIEILAEAWQSNGETMRLNITDNGRQVHSQSIAVSGNSFKKVIPVKLNADKKGLHKYNISVAPVKNELSIQNNTETIYIEVLDARQKISLIYDAVHPDITTIRQAIESNKKYEFKPIQLADASAVKWEEYSLVILYQPTSDAFALLRELFTENETPLWYILGAQADVRSFNARQKMVTVSTNQNQLQEVFAQPVSDFSSFTLSDSTLQKISKMPPLMAPYGNYGVTAANGVLLKQRIGAVSTSYPLLAFGDDNGRRIGVLTGEGLWRWHLSEFQTYGSHLAVEELFSQGVQYLTANGDQQRFRAYASKNIFDEGEHVLINAELYNDALDLTNTPDVKLDLKTTDGKNYSFLFTRSGQSYQLDAGALPVGKYSYTASTRLGPQAFTAKGQLTVKPLNLEIRQSMADHQLLHNIAQQSGGKMLMPSQISRIADLIRKNENVKTLVYEDKHYSDLIDVKWLFALILLLLSAEWLLRKREGEV